MLKREISQEVLDISCPTDCHSEEAEFENNILRNKCAAGLKGGGDVTAVMSLIIIC